MRDRTLLAFLRAGLRFFVFACLREAFANAFSSFLKKRGFSTNVPSDSAANFSSPTSTPITWEDSGKATGSYSQVKHANHLGVPSGPCLRIVQVLGVPIKGR